MPRGPAGEQDYGGCGADSLRVDSLSVGGGAWGGPPPPVIVAKGLAGSRIERAICSKHEVGDMQQDFNAGAVDSAGGRARGGTHSQPRDAGGRKTLGKAGGLSH